MKSYFFAVLVMLVSCASYDESTAVSTQGNHSAVPLSLAMLEGTLDFELDQEIFSAIENRLSYRDKQLLVHDHFLYLNSLDSQQWKEIAPQSDFIVLLELTKYQQTPLKKEGSAALEIDVHLSIYDLRHEQPHCVIDKIITSKSYIPKLFAAKQLTCKRKEEGYALTPYGLAHTQIAKDVASHIEDAVLLAKRL